MLSKRLSTMLLSGAAVTGLGVSVANAGLLIDVRAFTKNGAAVADPKNVSVAVGDTIIYRVFADVTGTNPNLPDVIQSLSGSFLSTGGVKGNLGFISAAGITAPFGSSGSSIGQQTDLDADGDLDVGSNDNNAPDGFFAIRSASLTGPRSTDASGNTVFPAGATPTVIPNGTEYRIVTTLRQIISAEGSDAFTNFRPRLSNTGGFWALDATETATDNGDGTTAYSYGGGTSFTDTNTVTTGPGVRVFSGGTVPEPVGLGLASLAGLGLLGRRRK